VNRAKQLRLDQGAGIADTAQAAGMSARTLKKIENGEDVNAASLARLSAFYGVRASELLSPARFDVPEEEVA
jgi:transcriptional regulator with XRE-family HTH domain